MNSLTIIKPKKTFSFNDIAELWKYKELLYFLTWRDLKVRYKQTLVGAGWAIFQPFVTMFVFTIFFSKKAPSNFKQIPVSHHKKFKTFFHKMLECHVYLPPSGFEACFLSNAHGEKELKITLKALGAR